MPSSINPFKNKPLMFIKTGDEEDSTTQSVGNQLNSMTYGIRTDDRQLLTVPESPHAFHIEQSYDQSEEQSHEVSQNFMVIESKIDANQTFQNQMKTPQTGTLT